MRSLPFLVATAAICLFGATAQAETISGQAGNCVGGAADVRTWRPELGAPAAFIADAYTSAEGTLFVGLGFDEAGYWSVEHHSGIDAGDGMGVLYLAHTTFAGARKLHRVYDGTEHASFEEMKRPDDTQEQALARFQDVQRSAIKQRLFTLAAGPWKVGSLSQAYRLSMPKRGEHGDVEAFTGWFAQAAKPGEPPLRFGIFGAPTMCWCDNGWRGYALAAPATKTNAKAEVNAKAKR